MEEKTIKMKKMLLITILLTKSLLSLGNYIDNPEYSYLKPFLKEKQQEIFNKLLKENTFNIEILDKKIDFSTDLKEKKKFQEEKEKLIKEKEKLIENLNINIIKYPERYTESAIKLRKNIEKLVSNS